MPAITTVQSRLPAISLEIPALIRKDPVRDDLLRVAVFAEQLHGSGRGFRAEDGALRTPHHLHPIQIEGGQMGQIDLTARIVEGHAIE